MKKQRIENVYSISIIMPTFNSEKTLEDSLKSIREQEFDQTQIEILLVDGGSTDRTAKIAQKYDAVMIHNARKLPEFAKQQGLLAAKGRYGIFIDSDESFINMNSLKNRVSIMESYPFVKNIVSTGQVCKQGENGVVRYANFIGDPFSNFVYRYNGYNRIEDLTRQYKHKDVGNGILLSFQGCTVLPLFDALGNMFEIETARAIYYRDGKNKSFAANIFSNMVQQTMCAVVMKEDFICHRAGLDKKTYLSKLKWRVKNNLFQTEGVGFAQRSKKESGLRKRKLFFIPYCGLVVPVVLEAVKLTIKNRDLYFLNHFWYTQYTFLMIVWYVVLKIFHYPVKMGKTYGKDKP
ncbi:MAG: glycosyltransferase family 2 protein [Lachnospiraceae bacterium]|nr:glycosyltransferase family 2 protein [Lachnospiraceae bacterium]